MEPIRRALPSEVTADGRKLRGFIPYNAPTRIFERGKLFTEVIRPGAFSRALAGGTDIISTYNHHIDRLLGRTASGTLRLTETAEGLRYEVELPDHAGDVRELLNRGDLRGSSFIAFPHADGERWSSTPGQATPQLRELLSLELVEVGPVVMPAYPTSGAEYRSAEDPPPPTPQRFPLAVIQLMERTL